MIAEENIAGSRVLRLEADRPPPIRNLSLAVIAGALMAIAFPGWEVWFLAFIALAPLLAAIVRERSAARSFGLGWLSGTLFFYASCWWITYPPIRYADFPPALAYTLAVIPCAISGLFFGFFALVTYVTYRRLGPYALLASPFTWVAFEWLRITTTGVGWNMLGYALAFQPPLVQVASIGGVYAVSFILAATSTTLAFVLVAPSKRAGWLALAATLALVVGDILYGFVAAPSDDVPEDGLKVLAVQPNIEVLASDASPEEYASHIDGSLERLERLSAPAVPEAKVNLVVWPEMPVPIVYDRDGYVRGAVAASASANGGYVLLNSIGTARGEGAHTNSAVLVGPDGTLRDQYDKVRLLPFGEYVPLRGILPFIDRVPALAGDFTPGATVHPIEIDGAKYAVSICFESSFPELARQARQAGAAGFVNLTNDAWFGPTPEPRQHLAHAVFRTVETRTPQVRVTNAGFSAHIDAAGHVTDSTPLFEDTTRTWRLPRAPQHAATIYSQAGDWLPILSALGSLGLLVLALARRRVAVIELD